MEWLFGGVVNLVFSALVGFWAGSKGRSSLGWFFLALITTPLIGSIALLIAEDKHRYLP
jgi:branched-subunit amino acid permease